MQASQSGSSTTGRLRTGIVDGACAGYGQAVGVCGRRRRNCSGGAGAAGPRLGRSSGDGVQLAVGSPQRALLHVGRALRTQIVGRLEAQRHASR